MSIGNAQLSNRATCVWLFYKLVFYSHTLYVLAVRAQVDQEGMGGGGKTPTGNSQVAFGYMFP